MSRRLIIQHHITRLSAGHDELPVPPYRTHRSQSLSSSSSSLSSASLSLSLPLSLSVSLSFFLVTVFLLCFLRATLSCLLACTASEARAIPVPVRTCATLASLVCVGVRRSLGYPVLACPFQPRIPHASQPVLYLNKPVVTRLVDDAVTGSHALCIAVLALLFDCETLVLKGIEERAQAFTQCWVPVCLLLVSAAESPPSEVFQR